MYIYQYMSICLNDLLLRPHSIVLEDLHGFVYVISDQALLDLHTAQEQLRGGGSHVWEQLTLHLAGRKENYNGEQNTKEILYH